MLVLSRKSGETIEFPELGISIEVVRVKGNGVRLGIKAPDSVRILRGELVNVVKEFEDLAPVVPVAPPIPQQLVFILESLGYSSRSWVAAITNIL